jgi:hypothetical protein
VGWQDNEGLTQDSDWDPYYSRNLRSLMLEALPPAEINPENQASLRIERRALVPSIARHPDFKALEDGPDADPFEFQRATRTGLNAAGEIRPNRPYTPSILNTEEAPDPFYTASMNDRQSVLFNVSDRFGFDGDEPRTTRIRVGDILAPLAVGPTFAPRILAPVGPFGEPWQWTGPANFRPGDWTTLPEALAAALGVEPPSFYNTDPGDPGWSLLSELVERRSTGALGVNYDSLDVQLMRDTFGFLPTDGPLIDATVEFVLDEGRLHLGAYSPFYNGNQGVSHVGHTFAGDPVVNANWGSVTFNPTEPTNTGLLSDTRVAFSEPPAQRLLSMVQAVHRGGDFLTTPVIGTVNVNTASEAVLRTVPGMAMPMQFSESRIDYDQYDFNENNGSPTNVTSVAVQGRQMEWAPGRLGGKTDLFPQPNNPNRNGSKPYDPVTNPDDAPVPIGIGDPFEANPDNPQFAGNGWRNVGEAAPVLRALRDRTSSILRTAAKRNVASNTNPNPLLLGFVGPGVRPEDVYDFAPAVESQSSFEAGPTFAFGDRAYPGAPASDAARMLGLHATNFGLDYSRVAVNGQAASSERPGLLGIGGLLALDVPRFESMVSTTDWRLRYPKIAKSAGNDPVTGDEILWFRNRPGAPNVQVMLRQETHQARRSQQPGHRDQRARAGRLQPPHEGRGADRPDPRGQLLLHPGARPLRQRERRRGQPPARARGRGRQRLARGARDLQRRREHDRHPQRLLRRVVRPAGLRRVGRDRARPRGAHDAQLPEAVPDDHRPLERDRRGPVAPDPLLRRGPALSLGSGPGPPGDDDDERAPAERGGFFVPCTGGGARTGEAAPDTVDPGGFRAPRRQGVAQLGRARGLGPRGRTFESCRPDSGSRRSRVGLTPRVPRPGRGPGSSGRARGPLSCCGSRADWSCPGAPRPRRPSRRLSPARPRRG